MTGSAMRPSNIGSSSDSATCAPVLSRNRKKHSSAYGQPMMRIASITWPGFIAWKKLPDCTSTITAAGKVKDMTNSPTVPRIGAYQASQPIRKACTSVIANSFHGR